MPQSSGVSHLLFADDTLLFFKAEKEEAQKVQEVLNTYANATGQFINPAKCSALFGTACALDKQEAVRTTLNIGTVTFEEKYLGLPVHVGKSKRKAFAYVKGGIAGRVYGWKEKLIAKSGTDTLVKGWPKQYPPLPCLVLILPKLSVRN